ncbi:MAG: hypothetical protein IKT42_07790 [Clostridia bacterium]|nr:hypothetical protein [Clostridia bacterium]
MKKKSEKEKLTLKNIEYDIRTLTMRDLKCVVIALLFGILTVWLIGILDSEVDGDISSSVMGIVILSTSFAVYAFTLIKVIIRCINQLVCIKNKTYIITTDVVVDLKSGTGQIVSSSAWGQLLYKPFRVYFSQNKRVYKIPDDENYKWSENNKMFECSVFNSSNIGDEFYLVIIKNKRIICAYNKKLFELEKITRLKTKQTNKKLFGKMLDEAVDVTLFLIS